MRGMSGFWRDRSGLAGADFALVATLLAGGRHLAMCYGTEFGALVRLLIPA